LSRIIYRLPARFVYNKVVKDNYDIEIAYLEGFPTRVIAKGNSKAKKFAFVHCDVSVMPVLQNFYKNKTQCMNEYSTFERVCFVSRKSREGFEKTFGSLNNSSVVHNVINIEEIHQKANMPVEFEYSTEGLKMISVGRLSPEKGYERLIKIVSELEKKYAFEIWILGDGDERSNLEALIERLNVKSVKLLGFQTNPYNYMKMADLYICPSYYEGYSTTVSECVELGIPVLTTDCAGMDEILVNGENGIIVNNCDNELKNGMEQMLSNIHMLSVNKKGFRKVDAVSLKEYSEIFDSL
jgi:glycosyltransferase involved in cell wall biosynthesis